MFNVDDLLGVEHAGPVGVSDSPFVVASTTRCFDSAV